MEVNMPTYIGLDTETYLIEPGLQAPPLVVMSMVGDVKLGAALLLRDEALATVRNLLLNPEMHLVLQNAA
ncbi:MAG: hypothetical protein EBT79_14135, partial [Actinobacteria bacterium]|nr:hypothetical protein [Actinomycetota bacterium]